MRSKLQVRIHAGYLFILVLFSTTAFAGGYSNPLQTTRAIGQAAALTAGIDDPSAVFYNPAALSEINGNQVMADFIYINTVSSVTNSNRKSVNKHDDAIFPTLFANYHIATTDLTFGIGVYSPFGLSTTYGETSFTRFAAIRSEFRTIYVTPTIAWAVTPWLSLGGGVSFVHASGLLSRAIFLGGPEGRLRLTDTDDAYGYNFGVLVKPNEQLKFGLTYRSRVDLDFNGADVKFNIGPTTFTKAHGAHVPLPPIISVGANWEINPKWSIEVVYDYTRWSEFQNLTARFATPLLGGLIPGFLIPQDWKNTSTIRFGTAYKLNESLELRGGVILDESPTPNRTLNPGIPGADLLTLNAGLSYKWRNLSTAISYMPVFYKTRRISNNVLETGGDPAAIPFPGVPGPDKYKTFQNFVAFNLGYRF